MKHCLCMFLSLMLSTNLFSQNYPDCSHLRVEAMSLDSLGHVRIELSNSCQNCTSGILSCVYAEMTVMRTVAPFDTIAASRCYCLWSPENDSTRVYTLHHTFVSTLPPASEVRISLLCGSNGFCDSIPFSSAAGINGKTKPEPPMVYPNPASQAFVVESRGGGGFIRVCDPLGKVFLTQSVVAGKTTVNISSLAAGLYIVQLFENEGQLQGSVKILVE